MAELTYEDYKRRLSIQELLVDAGYRLNRRDGLRYPSYVRIDSDGRRVRGDKFIVTGNGFCCFQPPERKNYNVISFIKEHPHLFAEYTPGMSTDRLVNLVCRRLLNEPQEIRETRIYNPQKEGKPFGIDEYDLQAFRMDDWESQKKFYPYFKNRGINLDTQRAFCSHFFLTSKHRTDGKVFTNLAFPLRLPKDPSKIVGMEERSRPNAEGKTVYKGMAVGSNASAGLWMASPDGTTLSDATDIYWFESGYDAMSYYQIQQKENRKLGGAVFLSTGGTPAVGQMCGVLAYSSSAKHHICFDNDMAGHQFTENLKNEIHRMVKANIEITPERKAYLESIPEGKGIDCGNTDLLPDTLRSIYGEYETAWEEAMSMRSSGLCHPDDIQEQVNLTEKRYKVFRKGLRDFLGLDERNDTWFERLLPQPPYKDWNDQLLDKRMDENIEQRDTEEQKIRFRR